MSSERDPGVAFRELIVPGFGADVSDRNWASRPASDLLTSRKWPSKGPRSLVEMTLTVVTQHLTKDSEAALVSLDAPPLLRRIWDHIKDESDTPNVFIVYTHQLMRRQASFFLPMAAVLQAPSARVRQRDYGPLPIPSSHCATYL